MLYLVSLGTGNKLFATEDEYQEIKKSLEYLGIKVSAEIVQEKMYRIQWFDYIDEEWTDIWCTEDNVADGLNAVKLAEVEYKLTEYN